MCQAPEEISRPVSIPRRPESSNPPQHSQFRGQLGASGSGLEMAPRLPGFHCSLPCVSSSLSLRSFSVTSTPATAQPNFEVFLIKEAKLDSDPQNHNSPVGE